ncbi:MAG: isopeptide-forming domain-containing fimbrial protein, partial [Pseudomonadota bacterium]
SGFAATIPVLEPDEVLTVTYRASVAASAELTESYINTASVGYDSAPGDNPNERTFTPVTDDHRVALPPQLDKTIIDTSLPETGDSAGNPALTDVNIGEEITYQLVITVPEIPMDNVTLTDTLPTGLNFVSADIVSVGSEITGVTDTDEATVVSNAGQIVTFNFGALDNAFSDAVINGNDQIVVTVTAQVADLASLNEGDLLTNSASLVVKPEGEDPLTPVTDNTTVEIVEPDVDIVKSVSDTAPTQGETITYTVTVTNDPGATGPAFNLIIEDPLPDDLTLTGAINLTGTAATVTSGTGDTLVISIPVLLPGESVTVTYEVFIGFTTPVFTGVENTASVTGGTTADPDSPGRPFLNSDSQVIQAEPIPFPDDDPRPRLVGGGIDDAQFMRILQIDPIYTGTAEYGANVTINLFQLDGSLAYVRNVVADAGGHWIAVFPRVSLTPVTDDFFQSYENSVLFDQPVEFLDDRAGFGDLGAPLQERSLVVGSDIQNDTYNVTINQDRPSTLPEDRGMFNARIFFAPAVIGEPFARGDVLSVDEVFENVADVSVRQLYAASVDPLVTGLNRFNYEFLSEDTALPGGSAR